MPNIQNPSLLASLFSRTFVSKIIDDNYLPYALKVFQETNFNNYLNSNTTLRQALNKAFKYLNENYRCEYVYKTAILNEVLLKRHSLTDCTYLTEFRAFNTKADIVILNGTSTVYEIKSDIDQLNRLSNQVDIYCKIFEKVFVVTNYSNLLKVKKIIPHNVGIVILKDDLTIETHKEAKSNINKLDKKMMFDSLRKPEYLSITLNLFGYIPNVPSTLIHNECRKLFLTLDNDVAHQYFLKKLKERHLGSEQIRLIQQSNLSFKSLLTDKYYNDNQCKMIKLALNNSIT